MLKVKASVGACGKMPSGNEHACLAPKTPVRETGHLNRKRRDDPQLKSGEYRLYSRKKNPKKGKRRNLGTFPSLEKAKAHERAVEYFKRQ